MSVVMRVDQAPRQQDTNLTDDCVNIYCIDPGWGMLMASDAHDSGTALMVKLAACMMCNYYFDMPSDVSTSN